MKRKVYHWNPCCPHMIETALKLEKVLSKKTVTYYDQKTGNLLNTYHEIVFSTPHFEDIERLRDTCANLVLIGKTEQVFVNTELISAVAYRKQRKEYWFTVACDDIINASEDPWAGKWSA